MDDEDETLGRDARFVALDHAVNIATKFPSFAGVEAVIAAAKEFEVYLSGKATEL